MQPGTDNRFFHGPLRVCQANPRYFADERGRAIYLTGSHTWANLVDNRHEGDPAFDYDEYLDMLAANYHNFIRLWAWHHGPRGADWSRRPVLVDPVPFARTGSGLAADGLPRFDLTRFNQDYFNRLRSRVMAAGERGIYVSVMLFEGCSGTRRRPGEVAGEFWQYHPLNAANNINGLDGDPNADGWPEIFSLLYPGTVEHQKRYIDKVIETVNDLDNVLYEVGNEVWFDNGGQEWEYHLADYIHEVERGLPKQHPVGITADGSGKPRNDALFASPADWVAPYFGLQDEYKYNPPPGDGSKVVISDTDHIWGIGGTTQWVWKSLLRGLNPIFMDPWVPLVGDPEAWRGYNMRNYPDWPLVRATMGWARRLTERVDLTNMLPHGELASSRYCLANPGVAYLAYEPQDARLNVNLTDAPGAFSVEWFNPRTGASSTGPLLQGERWARLISPLGADTVLYLRRRG